MSQNDIASILLTNKIEAKLRQIKGNKIIPLTQFLTKSDYPKKVAYEIDDSIFELLSYVVNDTEEAIGNRNLHKKLYPIKITSWEIIKSDNAHRFLVDLLIKNIITNLNLPILVKKKGNSLEISIERYHFTSNLILDQALHHQKELLQRIISFDLLNRKGLINIKRRLEKNKSQISDNIKSDSLLKPSLEQVYPGKESIKSITIITPKFTGFEYFWLVFNHNYENKHKMYLKNKFTGNEYDSNAACLLKLQNEKKIDYNHSFLGYMNTGIFTIKPFEKFIKTKLLKIRGNKIFLNDRITIEKTSCELLDKDILNYFSVQK